MRKHQIAILLLILFLGFFYRVYYLSSDSYWIDESYTVLASKNIGEYGYPAFDPGRYYSRALPQAYSLFIIGSVFGYSEFPMRILSVIAGTLVVLVIFLIVKNIMGVNAALFTSFLVALNPMQIAWSQQARMYIFFELFFYLAILFYLIFLDSKDAKNIIYMIISVLLSVLFLPLGLALLPIIGLHFLFFSRKMFREYWNSFRNLFTRKNMIWFVPSVALIGYFGFNYALRLKIVADYFAEYAGYFAFGWLIFIVLASIGVFSYREHVFKNMLLLLTIILVFLAASFLYKDLNLRYILVIQPAILIFSVAGLFYLASKFKFKILQYSVFVLFVVMMFSAELLFLPQTSYALEPDTPRPPFRDAYEYVSDRINDNELLLVTQPAIAELYYGKADYWIAIAYERRGISGLIRNGNDTYSNIPALQNRDSFNSVIESNSGYIVIDDMGIDRLSYRNDIQSLERVFMAGDTFYNRVYVYRFE